MKKKLKIVIFALLLISLGSCDDNNNNPVVQSNGFELRASTLVTPLELKNENENDIVANLEWDESDNGVQTSKSSLTYRIEIFEKNSNINGVLGNGGNPISVTSDSRSYTLKVKELNQLINKLPNFKCGEEIAIDVRIKSTLGTQANAFSQYSNPIQLLVKGYSTAKLVLSFVKDGDLPTDAPKILSSSFDKVNDFEGYMYLEPGNYKFYRPDVCGSFSSSTIYGGTEGNLEEGSSAPSINVTNAGHYYVTADLTIGALKYSIQYFRAFGIFGPGVKGAVLGSANAVPMSDATNSNVWKITFDLFKGKRFRFKSNDWVGDLTTTDPPTVPSGATTKIITTLGKGTDTGTLVKVPNTGTTGEITVPGTDDGSRQKYEIVIDVSKPRNYTYTLTEK